jgi:hypothetical protein
VSLSTMCASDFRVLAVAKKIHGRDKFSHLTPMRNC